ncbi:hypothetical protein PQ465_11830 [Sphingobacterium oryzagri]|uniref:Uncharacterized protein n=1 Tax=Sphingobacterium oryzagri TaxID=3025669 RepID=A0ABY7WC14_9SPHI|nr:hypothetical protein [Sphingobacterium sp. KACC 22765]WDF66995.1 hypothetical protein PQ465_11830 [Sphingobacterium sp. KACC 22765]
MRHLIIVSIMSILLLSACSTNKPTKSLLQDCPEEKIVNRMPMVQTEGKSDKPNSYFIYKGERREIAEFDEQWLKENCDIKETEVF